MNAPHSPNLEPYLKVAQQGDQAAREKLSMWMLDEAHRIAGLALQDRNRTMDRSSLISNALLRLVSSDVISHAPNIHYLRGCIYKAVTNVLIDRYRKLGRRKSHLQKGPDYNHPLFRSYDEMDLDLLELDRALDELELVDLRRAMVVRLRFFCGLTVKQVAEELQLSESTIEDDWRVARLWLFKRLG